MLILVDVVVDVGGGAAQSTEPLAQLRSCKGVVGNVAARSTESSVTIVEVVDGAAQSIEYDCGGLVQSAGSPTQLRS